MGKRKILIILGALGRDGITSVTLSYLENLNMDGLDVTLGIAGRIEPALWERTLKTGVPLRKLYPRNKRPIAYFFQLIRLLRKEKYDIVHTMGNSATLAMDMLAAVLGGCPVRIAHSHTTSCSHPKLEKSLRPLFYATYTHGFACGKAAGQWLFRNREFTVIPNGKRISQFLYDEAARKKYREIYSVPNDTVVLGHVGTFSDIKNHIFLLEILRSLPKNQKNYELWLLGEGGNQKALIEEKVKEYGIQDQVRFIGFVTNVEEYLSAMDMMLLPSQYEGMPNVVIEWQIAGLPCLLSDRVTRECKVMENVEFLSIDEGPEVWCDRIIGMERPDRKNSKELITERMKLAGFDMNENAKKLKELYFTLGKENEK